MQQLDNFDELQIIECKAGATIYFVQMNEIINGLVKFGKHIGAEVTTKKNKVFIATFMNYKLNSILHSYNKIRRFEAEEIHREDAKQSEVKHNVYRVVQGDKFSSGGVMHTIYSI